MPSLVGLSFALSPFSQTLYIQESQIHLDQVPLTYLSSAASIVAWGGIDGVKMIQILVKVVCVFMYCVVASYHNIIELRHQFFVCVILQVQTHCMYVCVVCVCVCV